MTHGPAISTRAVPVISKEQTRRDGPNREAAPFSVPEQEQGPYLTIGRMLETQARPR